VFFVKHFQTVAEMTHGETSVSREGKNRGMRDVRSAGTKDEMKGGLWLWQPDAGYWRRLRNAFGVR